MIRTARLVLAPVGWPDLADMVALKGNPGAFGMMLGGVRSRSQATDDMAADVAFWARRRVGIFTVRENGAFMGMTGLHERPDALGLGLRFAIWPQARGRGIAREAAAAALRFAHNQGERRVVAVARESNFASRTILGGIGMSVCGGFVRDGYTMVTYESVRDPVMAPSLSDPSGRTD
ncbi:GNAT family N-acetyltransferase [Lichenicoccus sp.]|uniref:GNAT family N-acetyltransferase n=1 Tax=Lichenicoccus sp. TaxID=2781899 RepID=UPI003D14380A